MWETDPVEEGTPNKECVNNETEETGTCDEEQGGNESVSERTETCEIVKGESSRTSVKHKEMSSSPVEPPRKKFKPVSN